MRRCHGGGPERPAPRTVPARRDPRWATTDWSSRSWPARPRPALARGGDFAELYAEDRRGFTLSLDDGRSSAPQDGRERGASVRVVRGDATYFGHVDGLAEAGAARAWPPPWREAVRGDAAQPVALAAQPRPPAGHRWRPTGRGRAARPRPRSSARCDERARAAGPAIAQVAAGLQRRAPARRGLQLRRAGGRRRPHARAPGRPGGGAPRRPRRDGHGDARRPRRLRAAVADARGRGRRRRAQGAHGPRRRGRARRAACRSWSATASAACSCTRPSGHGLEADAVQKRASVYAGRLGDQLAERGVSAYDDGPRPNAWGSDGIDDEGTPTQRHGRSSRTARWPPTSTTSLRRAQDGVASTGNGRRESFRHLPVPRMTNTYFAPGEATPEELIAGVERGPLRRLLRRRAGGAGHGRLRVRRLARAT